MTKFLTKHDAITLGYNVFYRDLVPDQCTRVHEYVHIDQIDDLGIIRFYLLYLYEFLAKFLFRGYSKDAAYLDISFEKEAREVESACRSKVKLAADTAKRP